jgi:integrase
VVPSPTVTFEDAAREWLRYVEHDRKRERSTVIGYRRAVESRILPALGHLALEDVDAEVAERWQSGLIAEGLSAPTVNKLRWKCEAIFKRAQRVWSITHNPFANLERQPHRPSGDFNILSPYEIAAMIRHAADGQDAAIFAVAAYAGLRLGEVRGLRWSDLDFGDRLIHVRRAYVRGAFKVPKSGQVRSVPMIDQLIPLLDRLSRRRHFTDPDDLAFVNQRGDPVEESALRRRFWKALDRAGVERVRFHDLRHSYGSLAVRAYRLDEVRAYMGHAALAMTMRYVHHVPAHDAAQRLSEVIAETAPGHPWGTELPTSRVTEST